jgi:hypothetical protein
MLVSRCCKEDLIIEQDWYCCKKCTLPTDPIFSLKFTLDDEEEIENVT